MRRSILRRGFTLIEILIVVVIIGILATMVVPKFADARREASVSSVRNQLQTLRAQVELYRAGNGGVLPASSELMPALVEAGQIRRVPEWPAGFSVDAAHFDSTGLLRLSYDPEQGGDLIEPEIVAGW
ncbi:MAG: prepilin-type N-terminal cleavage/methylation domain-containing protein [Phycisphaerales bacterium]